MKRITLIVLFLSGCGVDAPDSRFGVNLSGLRYEFFRGDAGIAPSDAILLDPNNPFRTVGVADDVQAFAISEVGSGTATYYAWGTILANAGPVDPGVAQYFVGVGLQNVFEADEFSDNTDAEDVRLQAIRAYQNVLNSFPGTLLDIDGSGAVFTRLATPAYLAIESLGGSVAGNWELIEYVDEDGNVQRVAIQGGGDLVFPPEFDPGDGEEDDEEEGQ